jgi:cytochrome b
MGRKPRGDRSRDVSDEGKPALVLVWDPVVRIFHWSLVLAYAFAYFTEEDLMGLHRWAGYVAGGLIAVRLVWGLVGPRYARFADFVYRPAAVWAYFTDLLRFRGKRYLGHSPAGGAMIIALLVMLGAAVGTGIAADENRDSVFEGLHAFFGNASMIFVVLHVLGVALASLAHRENLVRAMVTGRKRP